MSSTPYVIGQDNEVLAVYKPARFLVHPVGENPAPDVLSWLKGSSYPEASPVHRLDLGVSGVLLCALTETSRTRLGQLLEAREVEKMYWALVRGTTRAKGMIRRPLKDARRKKTVEARTRYTRLESFGHDYSLLRITLDTGRKHQIRRHLEGLNHPIVGDTRYRGRRKPKRQERSDRIWLHAYRITMPNSTVFEAPLPSELEDDLKALRTQYPSLNEAD